MKPAKKLVKELNNKTGPYSIKVKVVHKANAQTSPNNKAVTYQRITFADEEGSKIKTTLYNDEIEAYEDIIQDKMEYEISNAKLKPMPEKYRTNPSDHLFQLCFTSSTIIHPVEDVLGIVIYIEQLRQVTRQTGQTLDVREIVIVDHSVEQPLIITAWADLATKEGETLKDMSESFPVVGFTYLKPFYHKGFSLSTTTTTFVKYNPEGEKADALRAWGQANQETISNKRRQVFEVRLLEIQRITTTMKRLRGKKVSDVLQEERHWLHVLIPEFDRKDVRFYLRCSQCGTRNDEDICVSYTYNTCKRQNVISSPRMNVTFEASDETGSYTFTAFTEDAERLLEAKAAQLYAMASEEKVDYLRKVEGRIRSTPTYIQVGPATSLSRNRVLKWVIKKTFA
ncbi:hypothetical protein RND81_12G020000 [Saponaria officinalis]|uniref:Uncharacterized protein n=1 Tax=Saponaria officinalis TaxID=3572 RepID=A0AAW1H2D7_SAPOF